MQREVLRHLIQRAKGTEYGRQHDFDAIADYEAFARRVPVNTYEELKEQIDRMRHGEQDVLWPGRTRWYAKSSGTTNDKSKFIPVTSEGLKRIHYAGPRDAVAFYLRNNPKSRLFDGRAMILGGSHAPNYNLPGSLVGDLSAILIENINPLANLVRVPKKETALLADFEVKRDRIAREAMTKNVTNLSGVPSWMLSVLDRVMWSSAASSIWRRYGPTWRCSSTAAWLSRPTASSTSGSSPVRRCTIWRRTTPARASSAFRTTLRIGRCC